MTSWLDNLAAQHGGEESEEEDVPQQEAPKPVQPTEAPTETMTATESTDNTETMRKEVLEQAAETAAPGTEDVEAEASVSPPADAGYTGPATKRLCRFVKSSESLLKEQESLYVNVMLKMRTALKSVLNDTSKPLRTIGGLGGVSRDAKVKYQKIREVVLGLRPPHPVIQIPSESVT
jgi:hypothetical protein